MTKAMRHPEAARRVIADASDPASAVAMAMCLGKDPLTWAQAKGITDRTQRKNRKNCAYHCLICHGWHIGNPLRKKKKVREKP